MKMGVYVRDHYCDELYGESDNWCYTSYKAKILSNGEIDLEDLIKYMIEEGWLDSSTKINSIKIVEKDSKYIIYTNENEIDNKEPAFYIDKED